MKWVLFTEGGKWFGLGRTKNKGSFTGVCIGLIRFSWARGTVAEAIAAAVEKRSTLKSLDDICAERRARDAEHERKHPRDYRSGQFVEKGAR